MSLFRRRPADTAALVRRLDAFEIPADDTERRALAERYRTDPSPEAGFRFWKLAMPDIEAAFWATRRESRP